MRNPKLVCRYALMIAVLSVLSFAASDWSRGHLGVSLDLPVTSTAHATWGGGWWQQFWQNVWNNFQNHLETQNLGHTRHSVPEPSTTVLFGIGMAGAFLYRKRNTR